MNYRYSMVINGLLIAILSQLNGCSDSAQKGTVVSGNDPLTSNTATGDSTMSNTAAGNTAADANAASATPIATPTAAPAVVGTTPAPVGWILLPVIEGSSGEYRFGVVIDGIEAAPYFKLTGDLQTEHVIYCDEVPLSSCKEGLGKFYITTTGGDQNGYRIFNPLQPYLFTVGKQVVIVGIDAQNKVRSTSVGVLARTAVTKLALSGERENGDTAEPSASAVATIAIEESIVAAAAICQCQPDFLSGHCNLVKTSTNTTISWTPLVPLMPCDQQFCARFFGLGLTKQCAS